MTIQIISPKKLIEVAIPLDAINEAAAREKTIRHGHPSSLHMWWARRPLAAARAVIFAQMVNDPSWKWELEKPRQIPPGHLKASWASSRKRLFAIIEKLVKWEDGTNEEILEQARAEIRHSWRESCEINKNHPHARELFNPDKLPAFHDPFCGGGAIPLEAQRLGLHAYASDLNPVAVLINKAMIEIPPKFSGSPPVNSVSRNITRLFQSPKTGLHGLAEDIRHYGAWMRREAEKKIGYLFPTIEITYNMSLDRNDLKEIIGNKLTVIAWLWVRTVKSSNPAFSHIDVPLASTFILSRKTGNQAYVHPVIKRDSYSFIVKIGVPPLEAEKGTKIGRGANFRCLLSDTALEGDYIKAEGCSGRMGTKLMAIVAEGERGRIYLSPTAELENIARSVKPIWKSETPLPDDHRNFWTHNYGIKTYGDLFTNRQLVGLTTFSDLLEEARDRIYQDACDAGLADDNQGLDAGGCGATAYAEAVIIYLAFAIDKMADLGNSLVRWEPIAQCPRQLFGRQSIPMVWDFAESNPFSESSGGWFVFVEGICKAIEKVFSKTHTWFRGTSIQADAQTQTISYGKVISTDPPYYDNIAYADLSDFFYDWLRRSLDSIYPNLFATISVPKAEELVAAPYRHGDKDQAEAFFLDGMSASLRNLANQAHPEGPITIYYAFKQSQTNNQSGTSSTGWVTFLEALNQAGLQLTGTWPLRTENVSRMIGQGTNALASSIVLVCRNRPADSSAISRRDFIRELNQVLPEALDEMTRGSGNDQSPVAPVDLSQAIIGPGMGVFSKYSAVLEADGTPMTVKTALQLINRFLADDDFDHDTQFCLRWFEQHGWDQGQFGEADVLARAKGTSVEGIKQSGVINAVGGKVRLLKWAEYPTDWDPQTDQRLSVWEVLHHLIRLFNMSGETGAGSVLAAVQSKVEAARQLAYRLYTLCERAGRAEDARAYNDLITSWTGIESAAVKVNKPREGTLFEMEGPD